MKITQALPIALAATLMLPAIAQIPAPGPSGAAPRGPQVAYVVDIANKTGVLLGVEGLPPIVPSTSGSAKAPAGPREGSPMPASLMLHAGVGLPAEFYAWVASGINDRAGGHASLGVRGVETGGHNGEAARFSDATFSYLQIPALDSRSNAAITLGVKTVGVLTMESPGKAPTVQQVAQASARLASTRWPVSGFRITVGGKIGSTGVHRIESFTLKPQGALTLDLTVDDTAAAAFGTLAPKPPVKGQPKPPPPPPLDGQLALSTATGQVMVTIPLHEVQVTSIARQASQDPATGGALLATHVTLAAKEARILFAPAIAQ